MNSKLAIYAGNKPLALPEDFSISVELSNPLFNETEMYSYPVSIPLEGNRHFIKNIDNSNTELRAIDYEHTPMRIIATGIPFANGTAVMQDNETIEDSISLNVDASKQSFRDLIGDLKCNEVIIPSKYKESMLIGEKIDEVNVKIEYETSVIIQYSGKKSDEKFISAGSGYNVSSTFSPQALGFSYPAKCVEHQLNGVQHYAQFKQERTYPDGKKVTMPNIEKSYINVSDAYGESSRIPGAPPAYFCNARIAYPHHKLDSDGSTSSDIVEFYSDNCVYEDNGPLWVIDAERPQSGICFYVLFFLDCLFEQLGVTFDKSALLKVGDFKRLCFFTTKCAYDIEPLYYGSLYTEDEIEEAIKIISAPDYQKGSNKEAEVTATKKAGDVKLGFYTGHADNESQVEHLFDSVNKWLDSRGCGGRFAIDKSRDKTLRQFSFRPVKYKINTNIDPRFLASNVNSFEVQEYESSAPESVKVGEKGVSNIIARSKILKADMSASIFSMYANGKNFPAEDVATVLDSLENQFGIKFNYDYEQKKVTAYLLRDVFRNQTVIPLHADIHDIYPISEKITGIRVGYSAESDAKEQKGNVDNAVKDFNTDYDYIDYRKENTVTNLTYKDILRNITNTQQKVFIDLTTGNKYRVKIDSSFTSTNDMQPRLFEVASNKGVEIGDCSSINEDNIIELRSDFVPVGMVDANYRKALDASFDRLCVTNSKVQPTQGENIPGYEVGDFNSNFAETIMVAFFSEDMEHEFVKQYVRNPLSAPLADFYVNEELSLIESYDPSSTEDGNSPLQDYDWGLSIAIMRGGGVDANTEPYDYDYDGFGNSKWRTTVGQYALTTDSIDVYGNEYDYNGVQPGVGNDERISLKPRAWVQPEWADEPLVVSDPLIKDRGYVDRLLSEYIHFLLHRKKYRIRCLATVAQIADIPNHWHDWWLIGEKRCLINKVNTDISVKDGMNEVELEVYSL